MKKEHDIQTLAVKFLRAQFGDDFIIFAIPNGGQRHPAHAKRLKDEGVLRGVPDLCIPIPCADYSALYIEVKSGNNKLSPAQAALHKLLKSKGNQVLVCYSTKEIILGVYDYFNIVDNRARQEIDTLMEIKEN